MTKRDATAASRFVLQKWRLASLRVWEENLREQPNLAIKYIKHRSLRKPFFVICQGYAILTTDNCNGSTPETLL